MNKDEVKKDSVNISCDTFCTKRKPRETEEVSILTSKILSLKIAENNELSLTEEEKIV